MRERGERRGRREKGGGGGVTEIDFMIIIKLVTE